MIGHCKLDVMHVKYVREATKKKFKLILFYRAVNINCTGEMLQAQKKIEFTADMRFYIRIYIYYLSVPLHPGPPAVLPK